MHADDPFSWSTQQLTGRLMGGHRDGEGYRMLEAPDGPRALVTWDEHPGQIDLLLTDVVMPGA